MIRRLLDYLNNRQELERKSQYWCNKFRQQLAEKQLEKERNDTLVTENARLQKRQKGPLWVRGLVLVWAAIIGLVLGGTLVPHDNDKPYLAAPLLLESDQYQGTCSVVTPPAPDPCDAVVLSLAPDPDGSGPITAAAFWINLVNAQTTKNWIRHNPGEVSRLNAYLAAPSTSSPGMLTPLGAALTQVVQTRAYVPGGQTPGELPAPNAIDPNGTGDRKPPSAPTGLQVTP